VSRHPSSSPGFADVLSEATIIHSFTHHQSLSPFVTGRMMSGHNVQTKDGARPHELRVELRGPEDSEWRMMVITCDHYPITTLITLITRGALYRACMCLCRRSGPCAKPSRTLTSDSTEPHTCEEATLQPPPPVPHSALRGRPLVGRVCVCACVRVRVCMHVTVRTHVCVYVCTYATDTPLKKWVEVEPYVCSYVYMYT
jgi:hypothetical protein